VFRPARIEPDALHRGHVTRADVRCADVLKAREAMARSRARCAAAKLLTRDEARRIAANVTKLPPQNLLMFVGLQVCCAKLMG
jgi:hypothetical protein